MNSKTYLPVIERRISKELANLNPPSSRHFSLRLDPMQYSQDYYTTFHEDENGSSGMAWKLARPHSCR